MSYVRKEELAEGIVLYQGDCLEVLPTLGRFDAVVTDPPYGIGAANGASVGGTDASGKYIRRPRQYAGGWDNERASPEVMAAILTAAKVHVIWGGNFFTDLLPVGGRWLIWDKLNSMPTYSDGELAWTSIDGASVKKFTQCSSGLAANKDGRVHPTQKPLNLMQWCLGFVPNAASVVDPFMGSGTTGVACAKLGRRFTGIEIDPGYFDIACRRIAAALKEPDLFVEPPKPAHQLSILDGDAA